MRTLTALPFLALAAAIALTGCSSSTTSSSAAVADGTVSVVATTNVYGDIVKSIGGSHVTVTSIITDPSQDPHSFEGSAQVQLALSKADIVIENGGGYDDWAKTLLSGANNSAATVINVANLSGYDLTPASGDFNEHLWYDFPTIAKFADRVAAELSKEDPTDAASFTSAGTTFRAALTKLETREATLANKVTGTGVAITEPVPLYMLQASGFTNVTPPQFSEAVEEGSDVAPAVLQTTLELFGSGDAKMLVYNAQTNGPETDRVVAAAKKAGVPVVPVTETMPEGDNYLGWMTHNLDAIATAAS